MNLRRTVGAAVSALILASLGVLAAAVPASATDAVALTATVKSTPDDGCPTWARSTFIRTTTITLFGEGEFKVVIADEGTFVTQVGAKSPAGVVDIAAAVTGSITGEGEFTVKGDLLEKSALDALDGKTFDNSGYACKADVPAERTTAKWPLQFFTEGAETSGIDPWKWVYKTGCETRTESSTAEPVGDITGLVCPTPETPGPTPTVTGEPEPSVSASLPAPGAGGGDSLPTTGAPTAVLVSGAVALLAIGGVALLVTRKRRNRYVA